MPFHPLGLRAMSGTAWTSNAGRSVVVIGPALPAVTSRDFGIRLAAGLAVDMAELLHEARLGPPPDG
ncbi:hypothetical protein TPA0908_51900 [Micromonospora sp. AKA38]|nr:hypothetical protein TPA0908_51900 [Micromonospora sp. AKA38]